MSRAIRLASGTAVLLGLAASLMAQEQTAPSDRTKDAQEIARGVRVASIDGRTAFPLVAEPIYRFEDPARTFSAGGVWAFGDTGRPAALVAVALEKAPDGRLQWVEELASLSSRAIRADVTTPQRTWQWEPPPEAFRLTAITPAPTPSDEARARLRQMRELARRFTAYEFWKPADLAQTQRYELRLLSQPVHRYRDPASGIVDGGIFLFAYGQNPEIALIIEARSQGVAAPQWTFGFGRLAAARLVVRLDDREVLNAERPAGQFLKAPYEAFAYPADDRAQ